MNIIPPDPTQFTYRPVTIAGDECVLITPNHVGAKWTKQNLIFRSSIWKIESENDWTPVSLSFKKFFNWGEQPDLCYTPFSLKANGGCQILEKRDGSTLCVSKYRGELIVRTRGTADASFMENGHEIELLKEKYPMAFEFADETSDHTRIFEWESPENRIVIKHDEPDIKLTGWIRHADYTLASQTSLDSVALMLEVPRPRWYEFASIEDMKSSVEAFKGVEGVCVYCNHGQDIRKLKGEDYLARHRLKDQLCNFSRVVEYYFVKGMPDYQEFYNLVESELDWETAEEVRGDISRICDGMKEVWKIVTYMAAFADSRKSWNRGEAARDILQAYGETNRASFVFMLLDGQELGDDHLMKLLYQVLK